ncbi:MAG: glycoside hydrolase family 99-like domain-containing protein [Clostridia bacterium]
MKKNKLKILAFYLPQFHTFPENDLWWGDGFTEWRTVKNAKKYYNGHNQPRVPLNENYYCLNDNGETIREQSILAKKYGIYGFCFYHYWFDGKMLMEKPMEILLDNNDIDINYCICWANENWTRAWADKTQEILIQQTYGDREDWKKHFNYLLNFFKDSRYILENNKPIMIIYRPEIISTRKEMFELWNELALEHGFDGIKFIYQQNNYNPENDIAGDLLEFGIEYQPQCAMDLYKKRKKGIPYLCLTSLNYLAGKFPIFWSEKVAFKYSYDRLWQSILKDFPKKKNMYPGGFVDWDNTPRHKRRGSFCEGVTPEKFEEYLTKLVLKTKTIYKVNYIFLFAWNEWGEGGYLEADEKNKYRMLESVKNALINNGEFYE